MQFSWSVNESSVQFIEPGPDALAVDHDVLVVHQRAESDHGLDVEAERVDVLGRRRRPRHVVGHLAPRLALVVVDDAHAHAALVQILQRRAR